MSYFLTYSVVVFVVLMTAQIVAYRKENDITLGLFCLMLFISICPLIREAMLILMGVSLLSESKIWTMTIFKRKIK